MKGYLDCLKVAWKKGAIKRKLKLKGYQDCLNVDQLENKLNSLEKDIIEMEV